MEKYPATGDVRHPEVSGLCFGAAGLEVSDRGFVELAVGTWPMFGWDFSIYNCEPVGREQGPVAKGFTVDVHSECGQTFRLADSREDGRRSGYRSLRR